MSFSKHDARKPELRFSEGVKVSEKLKTDLVAALQSEFGGEAGIRINVTSHFIKRDFLGDLEIGDIDMNINIRPTR